MSVVFTIYYHPVSGEILAYQEGGLVPPDGEGPKGSARVCFDKVVDIWDHMGMTKMKVDPATKYLVPINQPNIVTENPPSAMGFRPPSDPNAEIRHAG